MEQYNVIQNVLRMENPFNSRNNLDYLHNHYDERFKKYFTFGKLIIALNMIGTDAQDRNNGLTYWASIQKCM